MHKVLQTAAIEHFSVCGIYTVDKIVALGTRLLSVICTNVACRCTITVVRVNFARVQCHIIIMIVHSYCDMQASYRLAGNNSVTLSPQMAVLMHW